VTKGTIKMFSQQKGFGFIACEDGTEVFFHHSAVQGADPQSLREGQAVEFQIGQGPKGKRAENVKFI
jgi:CspA family cold shock protein